MFTQMSSFNLCIGASALAVAIYVYQRRSRSKYSSLPLPPGPKGYPIIGNLLEMPTEFEWQTYHKWSQDLGTDILHVNAAGTDLIVLDSAEAVTDLLERRSSRYSDRARMPMINELMHWGFNMGFMPYGEYWSKHRRLMHDLLHPTAAMKFRPLELQATHNLLLKLLDNPENVIETVRYMAGETILSVAYGLNIKKENDPYIETSKKAVHSLAIAAVPGTFLVDMFPIMKYIPEWMPGAGFQKKAKAWTVLSQSMVNSPFEAAKREISEGTAKPSFTSYGLEKARDGKRKEGDAYQEPVIRGSAATMYTAGSDTTVSVISSCILGLLEHPEIVKKAQAELDRVVKPGFLPEFDDMESTPYLTALTMETLRWRDVLPIAIPRYLQEEDEYKGYRIPKGSIVIPNAWALLHDESVYPEPFEFKPERFLTPDGQIDKNVRDPSFACFGFGRRICPGRYMAFSAVWIALASMIYCFDITKPVDEDGNVIEPNHEYVSALIVFPKPFKTSFKPRSEMHAQSIRNAHAFSED